MPDRVILHCDLNGFYASVELLRYPEFRNVPMAVCGDPASRHGIILAKNEPAKAFGIRTAETVFAARKKCPQLVLLPAHHDEYARYSRLVNAIYLRYTDQVEPFGIDESWLDVTGSQALFGSGRTIAEQIRRAVREELGLTISVGVSFNKVFAKLGSDYKKPDAVTEISRENFARLIGPLPVSSLLFVGAVTETRLRQLGIRTLAQLAAYSPAALERVLGKQGAALSRYARGEDDDPVARYDQREAAKSVGNGTTFPHDLTTLEEVRTGLSLLCDQVGWRMRRQGMKCRGIQLSIKDPSFRVIDRQLQFPVPTDLTRDLFQAALSLFQQHWPPGAPVRLLTVTAIQLVPADSPQQLDLFSDQARRKRQAALDASADRLRNKYGQGVIGPAAGLSSGGSQELPEAPEEDE